MATSRPQYVLRFAAVERTLHWLLAVTFLLMMVSGLVLYLPSLSELAADRVFWKTIHLSSAVVFWAGLIALVPGQQPHRCETPPARSTGSTTTTAAGCGGRWCDRARRRPRAGSTPARNSTPPSSRV